MLLGRRQQCGPWTGCSRMCGRGRSPVLVVRGEVFGLAETARIGQRNGTAGELGPLAPPFAGRWDRCAGALGFFGRVAVGGGVAADPGRALGGLAVQDRAGLQIRWRLC